ncbi:hypothetical protein FBY41_3263 [Humibacillus xanthopallidus]|uniref:Uncharacterized protein n=1 Tax=Humibacillus xanthopallidus TaxID=412689 RepID=A0A543HHY2_9MICO|nr:hypothetical protein FBY41_3263 [Humibacillus xanthopallidus]
MRPDHDRKVVALVGRHLNNKLSDRALRPARRGEDHSV